jgi:hypothetical protein
LPWSRLRHLTDPEKVQRRKLKEDMLFTGSRRYGTPHAQSDFDWVIILPTMLQMVWTMCADSEGSGENYAYTPGSNGLLGETSLIDRALRFGPVNLLCVHLTIQWNTWAMGTLELEKVKPVTRDRAVEEFQRTHRDLLDSLIEDLIA